MKIKEIINAIENFAPLQLQESYDNSGLIAGSEENTFTSALTCIDVTEDVIDEAIKKNCNLIISHHPLIFRSLNNVTDKNPTGKCIIKAIKNEICIYASHTNLDNISNGVNDILCRKLGILNPRILKPRKNILKKLVTFCPADKADDVRQALFQAGAGHIGNYDCCSYNSNGSGSFRALENSNPYIGEINKLHFENETRIETIFPAYIENKLLQALITSHPYEEVAYDIYPLDNEFPKTGEGMIGELPESIPAMEFLQLVEHVLGTGVIRHSGTNKKKIKKVAICGGAGGFLIKDAISAGADIFLTADLKYHQFLEYEGKIIIADVGHYESEQFAKDILVEFLFEKFPTFAFLVSKTKTNPVHYFHS